MRGRRRVYASALLSLSLSMAGVVAFSSLAPLATLCVAATGIGYCATQVCPYHRVVAKLSSHKVVDFAYDALTNRRVFLNRSRY